MKKLLFIFILLIIIGLGVWYFFFFRVPISHAPANGVQEKETIEEVAPPEESHLQKGKDYAQKKFVDLALHEFDLALQENPQDPAPLIETGKIHLQEKDYFQAVEIFQKAYELSPQNEEINLNLAYLSLLQNNRQGARSYLQETSPENLQANYYLALLDTLELNRDASGTRLHWIVDNFSNHDLAQKAQKIIDAYREFDFYRDGQKIHLQTLLARALNQAEEAQLAIHILKEILIEKSGYRDAWILLGYAYFDLGRYSFAEDSFRRAYELDSEKPEIQYFLGITYLNLQQYEESVRFLEYALINGFEPKAQVKNKLAEVYFESKNYEKSVQEYEEVLKLIEPQTDQFVRPIWIYIDFLDQPREALRLAEEAVEKNPEEAMSYSLLGWAQLTNKDYANALISLEKAKAIDFSLPAVYLNLGKLFEAQGEYEKAKQNYKEAYEKGEGNPEGNLAAQKYNALLEKEN